MIFVLYRAPDKSLRCVAGVDHDAIVTFVRDGGFAFTSPINISKETAGDMGFELLEKAVESISRGHSSSFLLGLPKNVV